MAATLTPSVDPTDASTWPSHCPSCRAELTKVRQCLSHRSDGTHCTRCASRGQTTCTSHGAASPRAKAAGQRRLADAAVARRATTMGLPIEIDGHTALLQEVHRAAGVVAWLGAEVAQLAPDVVTWGVSKATEEAGDPIALGDGTYLPPTLATTKVERSAGTNALIKLWGDERDRLVRAAKAAIDCGVSERLVRLEESKGALLAAVIMRILGDPSLALSPDQLAAARKAAAREIRALPEAS